jgi:hypothetical protein
MVGELSSMVQATRLDSSRERRKRDAGQLDKRANARLRTETSSGGKGMLTHVWILPQTLYALYPAAAAAAFISYV